MRTSFGPSYFSVLLYPCYVKAMMQLTQLFPGLALLCTDSAFQSLSQICGTPTQVASVGIPLWYNRVTQGTFHRPSL
jgi:hypothetical protein